ncbi:retrovirus-related Pol polyprotein from transposon opus [Trichonephila clavipes]|nr:retrovirus-related Pol polyprotein from transposon opus [Trichonephila clavipes]
MGIANQSANQNNGQTSRVKSLDEIVKMVRLLTVKVPNKSDGWDYFFSSLEKAFASEMVSDELKPKVLLCIKAKRNSDETFSQFASRLTSMWLYYCKLREANDFESVNQLIVADKMFEMLDSETATHIGVLQGEEWYKPRNWANNVIYFMLPKGKSYDEPERAKWNDSERRSFNGSWGNVDETEVSLGILPEKAQEHIENSQRNITSCRNEVGTLGTKDEEVTAEMDKGSMVADSFRSEQECCAELALGLSFNVKKFCESCKECQLTRSVRIKDRSSITPVARSELLFQVVNMDLIGPIDPSSSKGHTYILCLVDQHTSWGEARPVTSLSAKALFMCNLVEETSGDLQSCSARGIARTLDSPVSTVHKILRNILHSYPCKISHLDEFLPPDLPARDILVLEFLTRIEVDSE